MKKKQNNEIIIKVIIKTQDENLVEDIINKKISNLIKQDLAKEA